MTQAKGSAAQLIGGIKETTFGSDPGTISGVKLPIVSSNLSSSQPNIEDDVLRGTRNASRPGKGNTTAGGSVVVPVDRIAIGYWLQMLLGDPDTTADSPSTGYNTHVFKVSDALDSWVLEQGYTDIGQYEKFNGVKVNSMQFSFDAAANSNLNATVAIEAAKETLGASSIDSSAASLSLTRFEIDDLALTEGGSNIAIVKSVNLTIGNNLDTNQYVIGGGGVRGDLPEGKCVVNGTLVARFEDASLLNKAKNSIETSLVATLTSGTYSLELKLNELIFGYKSPGIPGPQGIVIELPFSAYYDDDADASAIVATLVNQQTSY